MSDKINIKRIDYRSALIVLLLSAAVFLYLPIKPLSADNKDWIATLDPSWIYAINNMDQLGGVFGQNVFFTYGPLGRLVVPTLGSLAEAYIFVSVLLLYSMITLGMIMNRYKDRFVLFALALIPFAFTGSINGLIVFSALMMGLSSLMEHGVPRFVHFAALSVLTSVMFFVKFDLAFVTLLVMAGVIILYAVVVVDNHGRGSYSKKDLLFYLIISLMTPVLCVLEYLIYAKSLNGLSDYYALSMDIASNYSQAMTVNKAETDYLIGIVLWAIVILIITFFVYRKTKNGFGALLSLIPVLYAYKSSIVRYDSEHLSVAYDMLLISLVVLAIVLICSKWHEPPKIKHQVLVDAAISVILLTLIVNSSVSAALSKSENEFEGDPIDLPEEFISTIGDDTVTAYPWDILWADNDDINYVLYPTLQAYVAFDPRLDQLNASFFAGDEAPEYIIFENKTIDNRLYEWESPLTFGELVRNYTYTGLHHSYQSREVFLLQRRTAPLSFVQESQYTFELSTDESIVIDGPCDVVTLSISLSENTSMKLLRLIYREDPMYARVVFNDGYECIYRVLPSQLESECLLTIGYPFDDTADIIEIQLYSDDMYFYNDVMQVTVTGYTVSD